MIESEKIKEGIAESSPEKKDNLEELETKIQKALEALKEKPIIKEVLDRLSKELPKNLSYHNEKHTDEAMHDAVFFGVADGLSERELELLAVAAAYHDAGFIERPNKNEAVGAKMADEAMKKSGGYSEEEMKTVAEAIEDTEVKMTDKGLNQIEKGRNKISGYLLDADVGNFGRKDFPKKTELVAKEVGVNVNDPAAYNKFLQGTWRFQENHQWKTEAAKRLREEQKQENIRNLLILLSSNFPDVQ